MSGYADRNLSRWQHGGIVARDRDLSRWIDLSGCVIHTRALRIPDPDAELKRDTKLWNRLLRRLSTKRHRHRRNHRKAKR